MGLKNKIVDEIVSHIQTAPVVLAALAGLFLAAIIIGILNAVTAGWLRIILSGLLALSSLTLALKEKDEVGSKMVFTTFVLLTIYASVLMQQLENQLKDISVWMAIGIILIGAFVYGRRYSVE